VKKRKEKKRKILALKAISEGLYPRRSNTRRNAFGEASNRDDLIAIGDDNNWR
jgi:hypothetical protein